MLYFRRFFLANPSLEQLRLIFHVMSIVEFILENCDDSKRCFSTDCDYFRRLFHTFFVHSAVIIIVVIFIFIFLPTLLVILVVLLRDIFTLIFFCCCRLRRRLRYHPVFDSKCVAEPTGQVASFRAEEQFEAPFLLLEDSERWDDILAFFMPPWWMFF